MSKLQEALELVKRQLEASSTNATFLALVPTLIEEGIEEQQALIRDFEAWALEKAFYSYRDGDRAKSIRERVQAFLHTVMEAGEGIDKHDTDDINV